MVNIQNCCSRRGHVWALHVLKVLSKSFFSVSELKMKRKGMRMEIKKCNCHRTKAGKVVNVFLQGYNVIR